jgi:hypothetical protein
VLLWGTPGDGALRQRGGVAVMRKLLHAIYGMFTTNTDFVAEKFYAGVAETA